MAYDPAVQPCPRCGVSMPINAHFCRSCGLTQAEAREARLQSAAAPAPVAVAAPASAALPASDPFARGRRSRLYPAPLVASLEDAPLQGTFWTSAWSILVVICLLLLVLSVSGIAIFYYSSICSLGERAQLRGDIPLPCGTTFQDHLDRSHSGTTGQGSMEWVYTVDATSPAQLQSFYMQQLPENGWTLSAAAQSFIQQTVALQGKALVACKSGTVVVISGIAGPQQASNPQPPTPTPTPIVNLDDHVQAPLGGSLLDIILVPGKNLSTDTQTALGADCSGS